MATAGRVAVGSRQTRALWKAAFLLAVPITAASYLLGDRVAFAILVVASVGTGVWQAFKYPVAPAAENSPSTPASAATTLETSQTPFAGLRGGYVRAIEVR